MNPTVENIVSKVAAGPVAWGQLAIDSSRTAAGMASNAMINAQRPTRRLLKAGLKINSVTHNGIADLLKHQASIIEGTMSAGAKRLDLVAEADNLRNLIKDQVALLPQSRDRLLSDARATLEILNDAREELMEAYGSGAEDVADDIEDAVAPVVRKTRAHASTAAKTAKKRATKAAAATKKRASKKATAAKKTVRTAKRSVRKAATGS